MHVEYLFQRCLGNPIICKHKYVLVGFDLGEDGRDSDASGPHLGARFALLALSKDIHLKVVAEKVVKLHHSSRVQPTGDVALL